MHESRGFKIIKRICNWIRQLKSNVSYLKDLLRNFHSHIRVLEILVSLLIVN